MLQVDVHVHTLFLKRTIETISHSCTSLQISPSPHPPIPSLISLEQNILILLSKMPPITTSIDYNYLDSFRISFKILIYLSQGGVFNEETKGFW